MNPILLVDIHRGRITNQEVVTDYVRYLNDGEYQLIIRRPRKERSGQQNKAYWKLIVEPLAEELGYSREDMHEILKEKFLKTPVISKKNNIDLEAYRIKSSTELSTVEWEEFCSKIRQWASMEFSIYLKTPGEIDY